MWITCGDGIFGSKIFVYQESRTLRIIELTAYELYYVQYNTFSFEKKTPPVSGSSWNNTILKEMNVQLGTETSCYTSETKNYPALKLRFRAEFKFYASVILLQINQTTKTINSDDYSSNLII